VNESELLAAVEEILAEAEEQSKDDGGHITTDELAALLIERDSLLSLRMAKKRARLIWNTADAQGRLSRKKVVRARLSGPWLANGYKVLPAVE
jgi:hypothetical protein